MSKHECEIQDGEFRIPQKKKKIGGQSARHASVSQSLSSNKNVPQVECGVYSIQGRRDSHEDTHSIELNEQSHSNKTSEEDYSFLAVYDGHGGKEASDYCSERMPGLFRELYQANGKNIAETLKKTISQVEHEFLQKAQKEQLDAGTTVAITVIREKELWIGNVGDTEIVIETAGGEAEALTEVHNPKGNPEEGKRIQEEGGVLYHKRVGHPAVNPRFYSLALSRALGDANYKLPELTGGRNSGVNCEPYITQRTLSTENRFIVLACDGVWDVLTSQQVVDFVAHNLFEKSHSPQDVAKALVKYAYTEGSTDNITAIVAKLNWK